MLECKGFCVGVRRGDDGIGLTLDRNSVTSASVILLSTTQQLHLHARDGWLEFAAQSAGNICMMFVATLLARMNMVICRYE
jgi:hypothetical protein